MPNLIIIVLTQYLMRYSIINPIIGIYDFKLQMPDYLFALIVLSTVFIAAAGYVINDYFDRKIDQINKPGNVLIGQKINRRHAMTLHVVLNILGVVIGFYLAYVVKIYLLAFVYLVVTGLFWYYSTNYKRQFLIGNFIVAILTALVPLQIVLYENVFLLREYHELIQPITNIVFWWVAAFAFYAFITNLIREIIKDIEDFEGDNAYGRNSVPVILGLNTSKILIIILIVFTIAAVSYTYYYFIHDNYTLTYVLVAIILPLIGLIIQIIIGKNKKDFRRASIILKGIMFTGILYAILVQYLISYQLI
ncbi:MAG: UbiA family prenyltransferase [Chlorobi bacterium]|nr:UbiA family prenyltransferase [Chlorobiota bacterium]